MPRRVFPSALVLSSCVAVLLVIGPAGVASADEQPATPPRLSGPPQSPDFYFGRPRGAVGFRGSWLVAGTGSDIFDFVTDQLTVERSSFNAGVFAADLAITLSSRLDVIVGFERSKSTTPSEYRDYVDNDERPIQQKTSLTLADLSVSARFLLTDCGRGISRYAWLPRTVVPYVGGGAGLARYEFHQVGDFVDFADLSVFTSAFTSKGWTPSGHVMGGVDIRAYKKLYVTAEGRYLWASGDLGRDFVGFEPIDLSGFRYGVGIRFAF